MTVATEPESALKTHGLPDVHFLCCHDHELSLCGRAMTLVDEGDEVPVDCRQCVALNDIGFCPRGDSCPA